MDVRILIQTLVTVIVATGLIGYLGRSLFSHILSRDIERFKAELQKAGDIELVRLKAAHEHELEVFKDQLRRTAFEHQVRFTKLHETRAEVIAGVYKRLAQAERCFESLINPMQAAGAPSMETKLKSAQDAGNKFITYFDENRIYLDDELCRQIENFNSQLRDSFITFIVYVVDDPEKRLPEQLTKWIEAWNKLRDDVPPIRTRIESGFRALLGASQANA